MSSAAIEVKQSQVPEIREIGNLAFRNPREMVKQATEMANVLAEVIKQRNLSKKISGKEHVFVEGWTTLGAMLGILPRESESVRLEDGSYEATIELIRASDGSVIGRASAICGKDEPTWKGRPEYARKSMAMTRATGKAYRLAFSWIMVLAGYSPTPAEEMPEEPHHQASQPAKNGAATSSSRPTSGNQSAAPKFTVEARTTKPNKKTGKGGGQPYLYVTKDGKEMYCFDNPEMVDGTGLITNLFALIGKAADEGAEIEFQAVQKGQYLTIIGVKRIGSQEYEGNVPATQREQQAEQMPLEGEYVAEDDDIPW